VKTYADPSFRAGSALFLWGRDLLFLFQGSLTGTVLNIFGGQANIKLVYFAISSPLLTCVQIKPNYKVRYHLPSAEHKINELYGVGNIAKIAIKALLQTIDGLNNEFWPHI